MVTCVESYVWSSQGFKELVDDDNADDVDDITMITTNLY